MIRAANLALRLANILAARGKSATFTSDVRLQDDSDGSHPRLAHWDEVNLGPTPTQEEVDAASDQPIPPPSQADLDNLQKQMKALALVVRDYGNDLKAEIRGLAVLLVNKGAITGPEAAALKAYDGTGINDAKTVQDLKDDFAAKFNSLP